MRWRASNVSRSNGVGALSTLENIIDVGKYNLVFYEIVHESMRREGGASGNASPATFTLDRGVAAVNGDVEDGSRSSSCSCSCC